ncbi:MAG: alpha/beta hydrolase [Planctomycetota bacterium]
MRWFLIVLLVGFVGVFGLLVFAQRLLVFPGAYFPFGVTSSLPEGAERWTREIDGGTVDAIVMPGRGAAPETPGPAVVFFHGNGETIDLWADEMGWYAERGYTVLLPEYRGYGRSAGKPSQAAIVEDAAAFHDRLAALPTVDAERIVFHGRSLGGGVAAQLAIQRKPRALILASTFTSVTDAALGPIPVPAFIIKDPFPVEPVLKEYDGPVLILHGKTDQAVNVSHARRNAEAAADATLVIYSEANHNDMPNGHGSWDDILPFLDRNGLPWQVVEP